MTDLMQNPLSNATPSAQPQDIVVQVCDYWTGLRRNGALPARDAIDAREISGALPYVFLAELVTPKVARIRIAGHQIEDLMGMDMRGMPLSVLFTSDGRTQLQDAIAQVTCGARVMMALTAEDSFGLPQMSARMALLPLTDSTGRITRIMGVLDRNGEIGRRPRRFAMATQTIEADPTPISQPTHAPHLRVIRGGRS